MKKVLFIAVIGILLFSTIAFAQGGFVSPDQVTPNAPHMVNDHLFKNVPFPGVFQMSNVSQVSFSGFIGMGGNNYIAYVASNSGTAHYKFRAFKMSGGKITQKGLVVSSSISGNYVEPCAVSLSSTNAVFGCTDGTNSFKSYCITLDTSTLQLTISAANTDTTANYISPRHLNLLRYSDTQAIAIAYESNYSLISFRYVNTSGGAISSVTGHSNKSSSGTPTSVHANYSTATNITVTYYDSGSSTNALTAYPNGSTFYISNASGLGVNTGSFSTTMAFKNKGRCVTVGNTSLFACAFSVTESTTPSAFTWSGNAGPLMEIGSQSAVYQKTSIVLDDTYAVMLTIQSNESSCVPTLFMIGSDNEGTISSNPDLNSTVNLCDVKPLISNIINTYVTTGNTSTKMYFTPYLGIYNTSGGYALDTTERNYWYYDSTEKILYFGAPWCWNGNQNSTKGAGATFMIVPIKIEIDEAGARFGTLNLK